MAGAKQETVRVILTPDASWPDGIKKEFQSGLGGPNQLTFRNNHHPGFIVDFVIDDPHGTGYLFPADKRKAMWTKLLDGTTDECVTHSEHWSGFEATSVSSDFRTLTVSNPNRNVERFAFTLRFTKNPQQGNCIDWDPIGNDMNGPRSFASLSPATMGGAAIGAAIGALATVLLNPAAEAMTYVWGVVIGAIVGYAGSLFLGRSGGPGMGSTPHG